jgi:metallo-beta-lactamase family protein
MKISFLGAAGNVTGSKHLIESNGFRLLLDCGLYQGRRQEAEAMNRTLPFDAKTVDAVILSHAHNDHCGALPVMVKNGFAGKIYCTDATADIAKLIMLDSAKIQAEDAAYLAKKHIAGAENAAPLYSVEDVLQAAERFIPVKYFRDSGEWTELAPNLRFKFYDAGHILGSCVTVIESTENGATKTVAYTGDLGNINVPLLRSPEPIEEKVDALLSECTYGDRDHRPFSEAGAELSKIISAAIATKSKIIVPAFSLGRTQELIYSLHKLIDEKKIPAIPVYVDSPLAANILEVFKRHTGYFDEDVWKDFGVRGDKPFVFDNLVYTLTSDESKAINAQEGPFIVISASGMCEGGRIRHHLKMNVGDPNNYVLLTGYQAENTLGRKLQLGVNPVNILGEVCAVRAKVVTLHEFSAHADQTGLLNYVRATPSLKHLYLVHTEPPQDQIFRDLVRAKYPALDVEIPPMGMSVEL